MKHGKKIVLLSSLLCGGLSLTAQNGPVASGGDASGAGGSASYSVGQIDYITASGSGGTITQGLQQPYEIMVVTGVEQISISLAASAYPNPATDLLTLSFEKDPDQDMMYAVYDEQGKMLRIQKISSKEEKIAMNDMAKAVYFIKVIRNNKELKTFKIIKN